jgi:hypothetical protein
MIQAGSGEKIYTSAKMAATVEALAAEGAPAAVALEGVGASQAC